MKILEDICTSYGKTFWKSLPSHLPPLLQDFRFASLFCVRLIVQRSPAVLPLCGLNTAGEPASLRPCQGFGYLAKLATLLQKGSLEGGSAFIPPRGPSASHGLNGAKRRPRGAQEAAKTATFWHVFFNAFWDRFFIDFPSQLGSILASKIEENR